MGDIARHRRKQRRRYITTQMLQMLKHHHWLNSVTIMDIASSHPAAVNALCKFRTILGTADNLDLDFMRRHAAAVLDCSPLIYLHSAPLCFPLVGHPRERQTGILRADQGP
ncbi:hypothetical protein BD414DRAFT_556090 [Trametes punicea]|nr:hypothetical protein BD414DRAFT_556090 [Trametes punicea]